MSELVVTREVAAPTGAVWAAWSEPSYLMQWWGPDGFSCPSAVIDFREGGSAVLGMRAPAEMGAATPTACGRSPGSSGSVASSWSTTSATRAARRSIPRRWGCHRTSRRRSGT
jgi:hypothetical protein